MTESERHELYEIAKNEISDRFAELMINALPPDTDRLATKDDLTVLGSNLRTEMADLRAELKTDMAELRLSVSAEIHEAFRAQTRTLVMGLVASVLLIALTNTLTVLVG